MAGPMDRIRETEEYKRHAAEMEELIEKHGLAEAHRIAAEPDHKLGLSKGRDYTEERRKLFRGWTLDDWMKAAYPDYQPQKAPDEHAEQPAIRLLQHAQGQLTACRPRLARRLLDICA